MQSINHCFLIHYRVVNLCHRQAVVLPATLRIAPAPTAQTPVMELPATLACLSVQSQRMLYGSFLEYKGRVPSTCYRAKRKGLVCYDCISIRSCYVPIYVLPAAGSVLQNVPTILGFQAMNELDRRGFINNVEEVSNKVTSCFETCLKRK